MSGMTLINQVLKIKQCFETIINIWLTIISCMASFFDVMHSF